MSLKSITDKWFKNQKTPTLRHEFPLLNVKDNIHFGEDPGAIPEDSGLDTLEYDGVNHEKKPRGLQ